MKNVADRAIVEILVILFLLSCRYLAHEWPHNKLESLTAAEDFVPQTTKMYSIPADKKISPGIIGPCRGYTGFDGTFPQSIIVTGG